MAAPEQLRIGSWRAARTAERAVDGMRWCPGRCLAARLRVALVVGTMLMVINQGDVLLSGHLTAVVAAKIGLTYTVPFAVATYSALAANRLHGG